MPTVDFKDRAFGGEVVVAHGPEGHNAIVSLQGSRIEPNPDAPLLLTLIERDADPLFLTPYYSAMPGGLVGFDDQLKFVRNAEGGWNVKSSANI